MDITLKWYSPVDLADSRHLFVFCRKGKGYFSWIVFESGAINFDGGYLDRDFTGPSKVWLPMSERKKQQMYRVLYQKGKYKRFLEVLFEARDD